MACHATKTGLVTLLREWGHGRGVAANDLTPAILVTDDGDGHFQQWKYTGKLVDALFTLACLEPKLDSDNVAVRRRAGYVIEPTPDDFWLETDDGDFIANTAKYPDVIAY